ncbi:helix-turn-helix domain-containing protein [Chitinophaga solisilvae]|uniref:helix-turn-helix domain-containing protein n=1 Tax=Chitinophaga solisilvae TaxID=1233460 RepID=UPI00136A3624|nr:helix-turn-helix domain-containing protein [Chitinophaga solisilvae]
MEKPTPDNYHCLIEEASAETFNQQGARPLYGIFFLEEEGRLTADVTQYSYTRYTVLFTTPWQLVHFDTAQPVRVLWFHSDYYCIAYHKEEVACNGLLFNNIYAQPFISVDPEMFMRLKELTAQLEQELPYHDPYSRAIARTYLQLILAISSKTKVNAAPAAAEQKIHHPVAQFKELLEQHFIRERGPAFYAAQLGMSPNTFSKNCRAYFLKSPSDLIQERVILEAKKLIHLSFRSIKEIAAILHFDDEHYFSRYFKKHTGIAPTAFRESVGISPVAHLSIGNPYSSMG